MNIGLAWLLFCLVLLRFKERGNSGIAVRFEWKQINPFLPLFGSGSQFPRRSCYSMIAIKVIEDTLMIRCHELPVADAQSICGLLLCLRTNEGLSTLTQLTALFHSFNYTDYQKQNRDTKMDQLQRVQDAFRNLRVSSTFYTIGIKLMAVGEQDIFQSEISSGIRMSPRCLATC